MRKTPMNSEKKTQFEVCIGCSIIFFVVLLIILPARAEFGKRLTKEQQEAVRQEIQEAVRTAQNLSHDGKYDEALRLLYDTMYQEHRIQMTLAFYGDEKLPVIAAHAIGEIEQRLVHEDSSPLMQLFRDPEFSLQQKQEYISQLGAFVEKPIQDDAGPVFLGQYRGTLVQLMSSRRLSPEEKSSTLAGIEYIIRTAYTSSAQQEQMKEEMMHFRALAEQKFRERQYVEAFVFLSEAVNLHNDIWHLEDSEPPDKQVAQSIKDYVGLDKSPLMKLFKDRKASVIEKQQALSELKALIRYTPTATNRVLVLGKYDGPLVQIMSHPTIKGYIKYSILQYIEDMSK